MIRTYLALLLQLSAQGQLYKHPEPSRVQVGLELVLTRDWIAATGVSRENGYFVDIFDLSSPGSSPARVFDFAVQGDSGFGLAMTRVGDCIAIGAPNGGEGDTPRSGRVYVIRPVDGTLVDTLEPGDLGPARFGSSLTSVGDFLVVGAKSSASVYLFVPDGNKWKLAQRFRGNGECSVAAPHLVAGSIIRSQYYLHVVCGHRNREGEIGVRTAAIGEGGVLSTVDSIECAWPADMGTKVVNISVIGERLCIITEKRARQRTLRRVVVIDPFTGQCESHPWFSRGIAEAQDCVLSFAEIDGDKENYLPAQLGVIKSKGNAVEAGWSIVGDGSIWAYSDPLVRGPGKAIGQVYISWSDW